MILLILDKKIINFDRINCIYIEKNGIMDLYRQNDIYTVMISIAERKKDIEIYRTEDKNEAIQKLKHIISFLPEAQKIYFD